VPVSIVRDPRLAAHDPGPGHPESPARLGALEAALQTAVDEGALVLTEIAARPASREEVARAHSEAHLSRLEAARGRVVAFDEDTFTSAASVDAAWLAAGAAVELAERVARRAAPPGLALLRPPGHHATRERSMGFCLINNVAVAAHALLARDLAQRIAIYDWDVHHGNGTQDIFYEDPRVLFMSTHQHPLYPGTGAADEVGRGPGEGTTVNVPLPPGSGDQALLAASRELLVPRVRAFAPDMILISAGFDPYVHDPLGGLAVTVEGFGALAALWRELAEELCGGRIAAVLEGGYHLEGLGRAARAMLEAWSRAR
jgi:acetoin utilization deacetylase AcuC-like enzyme